MRYKTQKLIQSAKKVSPCLFQVVKVFLIQPDATLEAAALGHFHVHGADVLLAIILTFLPQSAKTTERHASRLEDEKGDD